MIPVPMLALVASPTDKQISKIVTLDYPTGQNSVAIITGLGELFLQGYNHYGECAVGETTAFYDHFAQITDINGLGQVSGYPQNPTYTGRISVTFAAG